VVRVGTSKGSTISHMAADIRGISYREPKKKKKKKKKKKNVPVILVHFLYSNSFEYFFIEIYSTIKFHENPSSGSRVVPC
jgi:hypothetical protein